MDLSEELRQITIVFDRGGIDYAVCGALAMAIYVMPRATLDIDLMIQPESLASAKHAVEPLGFILRGAPTSLHHGAVKISRLCKIDSNTAEALILDLLLVTDETIDAWGSRRDIEWCGRMLKVVSPAGLILLKSLRGSGTDLDDIRYLRSILDEDRHET